MKTPAVHFNHPGFQLPAFMKHLKVFKGIIFYDITSVLSHSEVY